MQEGGTQGLADNQLSCSTTQEKIRKYCVHPTSHFRQPV